MNLSSDVERPDRVLCGALLVDKPSGPTSYDLIRWLKGAARGVKIGHCGTLDPLASGLVILLLGRATRRQSEFMKQRKIYRCRARLGVRTDSADVTGKVLQTAPVPPLGDDVVEAAVAGLVGPHQQVPPMFSALKKDGQPLYKLARKGDVVERAPRRIEIYASALLDRGDGEVEFRVDCSSGTYVRVLAEELGARLGTVATMSALRREAIGSFRVEQAVEGEALPAAAAEWIAERLFSVNP